MTYKIDFEKFNRKLFPCWFLALRLALLVTSFICIPPFIVFIIGLSYRTVHTTLEWFYYLEWIRWWFLVNSDLSIKNTVSQNDLWKTVFYNFDRLAMLWVHNKKIFSNIKWYDFLHSSLLFPFRLWYTLCVESFKAVAISIKVGDAYEHLYKIYRKEVVLCQSMKHWH